MRAGWSGRVAGWFAALDPGLARWRSAWAATLCLGVALLAEFLVSSLVFPGQGALTAMLAGGVAAMQGSAAVLQRTASARIRFGLAVPVAATAGISVAVLLREEAGTVAELLGFVAITFGAVLVRRYGPAFAVLGLVGWTGCYVSMIVRPPVSRLPSLVCAEVVAGLCIVVLSLTLFRHRPHASLRHALRGWHRRTELVFAAAAGLLERPGRVRRTRLDRRYARLSSVALTVEGWLADPASSRNTGHAAFVRERLLRSEAAVDVIVESVRRLGGSPGTAGHWVPVLRLLARGSDEEAAEEARHRLESLLAGPEDPAWQTAVAVLACVRAGRGWHEADGHDPAAGFTPVVAVGPGGALPGMAGVAAAVAGGALPVRQAVQTTVAAALAIVLGMPVSPTQYYWSLIAVFIVLLGPATVAETVSRGLHRVAGTVLGCLVAIPVTALLHGNPALVIPAVLLSCLLGYYLMPVSYAVLVFFITLCVFQLYDLMHSYHPGLLPIRLAETALGAAIAVLVAWVVLPVRARDAESLARRRLFQALGELLEEVRPAAGDGCLPTLSRAVDEHRRQFALAAAARPLWTRKVSVRSGGYVALVAHTRRLAVLAHDSPHPVRATQLSHTLSERREFPWHEWSRADPGDRGVARVRELLDDLAETAGRHTKAVLSGRVAGPDGAPVVAATVTAVRLGSGASRVGHGDSDGRYRLDSGEAGAHLVVATAPGYAAVATWLFLGSGRCTKADVTLARDDDLATKT
ncbi:FUSC family protein [Amycolatopsis acidicola]|uniref:FUSC family protein n=1 Tax=Amycolatopsis acidicola TaxID=2596893 RepID=UPI00140A324E|nr:FUSC family protein [Amycolatopsis acidicola]